ncbi:thiamine diphosphokinase [Saliterribacillus persicus]|uniref:Thiamine diphosphokinase n=1 Tax=Saliterribacillus persicus TaxID=930114 RepID=A0A368XUP0_9BACI|nr:thiamine diphosphokinase [Saliterribacillus persicus]RCW70758.1 thiamine diphosphokinase [Saliterribacillus persicus]
MVSVGIVAGGPKDSLPELSKYKKEIDVWIGADQGAKYIVDSNLTLEKAIGDFDSLDEESQITVRKLAVSYEQHPREKDATDFELALLAAIDLKPTKIFLFGVTGGRMDHTLINVQQLYRLRTLEIEASIIDYNNHVTLYFPGKYEIQMDENLPYISFIPFSSPIHGLTLDHFYYPLQNKSVHWSNSLCISNQLIGKKGTFSFDEGILLVIKSRD